MKVVSIACALRAVKFDRESMAHLLTRVALLPKATSSIC